MLLKPTDILWYSLLHEGVAHDNKKDCPNICKILEILLYVLLLVSFQGICNTNRHLINYVCSHIIPEITKDSSGSVTTSGGENMTDDDMESAVSSMASSKVSPISPDQKFDAQNRPEGPRNPTDPNWVAEGPRGPP